MKFQFDTISVQETLVILVCGTIAVFAIRAGSTDLAMAVGSGLVGYLGGSRSNSVTKSEHDKDK